MREFPPDYDHCFLGNGTDGVLVGYTGAMVPERVNAPEQCVWYKSDRYYPIERPVMPVLHRHYRKEVTRVPDPRDSWLELAPLGRCWYVMLDERGNPCKVMSSRQHFEPRTATLTSEVGFVGGAMAQVTTVLHPSLPLLIIRLAFDRELRIRASIAGGPWTTSGLEPSPLTALRVQPGEVGRLLYEVGDLAGEQLLWLDQPPERWGQVNTHEALGGPAAWIERRGQHLSIFHAIVDARDSTSATAVLSDARALGADGLLADHRKAWAGYRARSSVTLPDPALQRLYDAGLTLFRSIQSPVSGGIPVGITRQTWSSHLFWDAYYPLRALLEANHPAAARAHCGFILRTAERARQHALATFGVEGLAWDWELTHDGRRAYGADWAHLAYQVHNTAAYSNMLYETWRYTRDAAFLAEVSPVLQGIAAFFHGAVIEERPGAWGTRPLVGVHESELLVRDDLFNLAGAIRVLRNAGSPLTPPLIPPTPLRRDRERGLGVEGGAGREGGGLLRTLDGLFDGRSFRPYADATSPTLSSLAPIWPMEIVAPSDPRARSTARLFLRSPGFLASGGWPYRIWEGAILARIFADQDRVAVALDLLRRVLPAMNMHGAVCEYLDEGRRWNLQYFATAHGALCSALHGLLLGRRNGAICPFPSASTGWQDASYERLLLDGLEVSARLESGRVTHVVVTNPTAEPRSEVVRIGRRTREVALRPGESWSAGSYT